MAIKSTVKQAVKAVARARGGRKVKSSSPHDLIARKVQYDWRATPIDWIDGEPFSSHFINAMHLLLPGGEFWMCRMMNKALPHITDPKLREDMQLFVRQEAMHARSHDGAAEQHLRTHGLYPEEYMRRVEWLYEQLGGDKPLGVTVPASLEKDWLTFRLGVMAALEHLTCVLGQYAMGHKRWEENGADPVLLDLLRWHGAEEVEHRAVAFDAYRGLGGSYAGRFMPAVVMVAVVLPFWIYGGSQIMRQHPALPANTSPLRPWFWRQWRHASDEGFLPSLGWLLGQMGRYLRPDYNPIEEGSTEQALAYLATSPGYLAAQQAGAAPVDTCPDTIAHPIPDTGS